MERSYDDPDGDEDADEIAPDEAVVDENGQFRPGVWRPRRAEDRVSIEQVCLARARRQQARQRRRRRTTPARKDSWDNEQLGLILVRAVVEDDFLNCNHPRQRQLLSIYSDVLERGLLSEPHITPETYLSRIYSIASLAVWVAGTGEVEADFRAEAIRLDDLLSDIATDSGLLADIGPDWLAHEANALNWPPDSSGLTYQRARVIAYHIGKHAYELRRSLEAFREMLSPALAAPKGRPPEIGLDQAVRSFQEFWSGIVRPGGRAAKDLTVQRFIVAAFEATGLPMPVAKADFEQWVVNRLARGRGKAAEK